MRLSDATNISIEGQQVSRVVLNNEVVWGQTTSPGPNPPSTEAATIIAGAGPRLAPTSTMSGAQAKSIIESTGLLERASVTGSINLSDVTRGYTIRDCTINANGASYGIRTLIGYSGVPTPTAPQLIEHCEVYGASSAGLYIRDVEVNACNIWANIDNIKSADRVHVHHSWLHDQSFVTGAHADAIQIQYGVDQFYEWNVIIAICGDASIAGARAGSISNAVLQTGGMLGNASGRFHNNWFNGGVYTIRLGNSGPPTIDYQFRNNKFGRVWEYGPVTGSSSATSSFGGVFFDSSNIFEDTGEPVL